MSHFVSLVEGTFERFVVLQKINLFNKAIFCLIKTYFVQWFISYSELPTSRVPGSNLLFLTLDRLKNLSSSTSHAKKLRDIIKILPNIFIH